MLVYPDARLPDSVTEVIIIRMLDVGKRFRRDDIDAQRPDAQNIVAQFSNAFSIGFVLLGDHRSTIADLILTDC